MPSIVRLAFGVVCVAAIDQGSKFLMLRQSEGIDLIQRLLVLQTVSNDGIAFSLPVRGAPLIVLTVVILSALTVYLLFRIDLRAGAGLWAGSLLVGGGLGNLLDRVVRGSVVDFISVWRFPVFNLADVAVAVGVGLFILFHDRVRFLKPRQQLIS
jgi:signal peptidase II